MDNFRIKCNALSACLDNAMNELNPTALHQNIPIGLSSVDNEYQLNQVFVNDVGDNGNSQNLMNKSLKQFRGKESIFKKPQLPIRKCLKSRQVPAYKRNPDKWTRYNLSDVDISDRTNVAAAFDFFQQLDKQLDSKAESEEQLQTISNNPKFEFKKSIKIIREFNSTGKDEVTDVETDLPKFRSCKFVMPECVVGQTTKKNKPKKTSNIRQRMPTGTPATGKLLLSHLVDDQAYE